MRSGKSHPWSQTESSPWKKDNNWRIMKHVLTRWVFYFIPLWLCFSSVFPQRPSRICICDSRLVQLRALAPDFIEVSWIHMGYLNNVYINSSDFIPHSITIRLSPLFCFLITSNRFLPFRLFQGESDFFIRPRAATSCLTMSSFPWRSDDIDSLLHQSNLFVRFPSRVLFDVPQEYADHSTTFFRLG